MRYAGAPDTPATKVNTKAVEAQRGRIRPLNANPPCSQGIASSPWVSLWPLAVRLRSASSVKSHMTTAAHQRPSSNSIDSVFHLATSWPREGADAAVANRVIRVTSGHARCRVPKDLASNYGTRFSSDWRLSLQHQKLHLWGWLWGVSGMPFLPNSGAKGAFLRSSFHLIRHAAGQRTACCQLHQQDHI